MNELKQFTSRNLKIYLRDKTAVFFSLLTMLIIIILMVVFIGDMNITSTTNMLNELGVADADTNKTNSELLILWWTIAGIVSINAVTITLASITNMINDVSQNRIQSFHTAPVSKAIIALSYMSSAWISSILICSFTLIIAEGYAVSQGADFLSVKTHFILLGMIILNSFTYSSLMYFIAIFIKSEAAWSSVGTIVGTLVGFLGAIYMPMASIPDGVQKFLKCLPVLHGTAMFRDIITEDILSKTFDGVSAEIISDYKEAMGITVYIKDTLINGYLQFAILFGCGLLFLIASIVVMKNRNNKDR